MPNMRDFLVASYKDATRMSNMSGDFPVQLATCSPDWSASGLLQVVLPICPFYKFHEPDMNNLLRTCYLHVRLS